MNVISKFVKHKPIFLRPKENYQDSLKFDVAQDTSIAEGINHASNQEKPESTPDEIGKEPPSNKLPPSLPNVWIYDREVYDLSDFIKRHPGGEFFIGRMKNRDITTVVNIFHPNHEKVKKMLNKFALNRKAVPEDIHPKCAAPEFLQPFFGSMCNRVG